MQLLAIRLAYILNMKNKAYIYESSNDNLDQIIINNTNLIYDRIKENISEDTSENI